MLRIILSGCCGKMGKVLNDIVKNDESCKIVAGVDPVNTAYDGFPVFDKFDNLPNADVIVDFSNPSALDGMLTYAAKNKLPCVIATTGYSEQEIKKIQTASTLIPIFFTSNLSLGINLLVSLSKKAAEILGGDFDVEIIEKHHNQKIDAPSGTAIMLANAINETMDNKMIYEYDRHAKRAKRSKNEIGMHSVRGGTIVGEHEIIFAGNDEVVSLKHQAFSKSVFVAGALKAAKFIHNKPAAMYDMNDLILL